MVEITTATVATEAEREAATSYIWGQTSTGPIVERRFALSDMVFKDVNGKVQIGGTSPVVSEYLSIQTSQNAATYSLVSNPNTGSSATAGWYLNTFGNGWGMQTGSTAKNSNALEFILDPFGTPSTKLKIDTTGNVMATGTGGIGYGTGAGGTVTQTTSRTTGVTVNKSCGAITLVSAAGSTSWQSFTVTNSVVAATDTVVVSQKSGTDLYEIHVTNVAAGSFKISFKTTSGTTTEQPVFNFAIIRAVTS